VVIYLGVATTFDLDGVRVLSQLATELHGKDVTLYLAKVGMDNLELLRKTGALDVISADNVHRTVREAVAHATSARGSRLR